MRPRSSWVRRVLDEIAGMVDRGGELDEDEEEINWRGVSR